MSADDWFLSTAERDNAWTRIDRRHGDVAWTNGNQAWVHVHGDAYFARLRELVEAQEPGDLLLFTDWRGDPDERVSEGDDLTIAGLLADAARRGVVVKGLCWRSHLDRLNYSESENRLLADEIRDAGGEVILDMRVLPLGSHHQKFVVLRHPGRPERDRAFAGGIDMCWTRRDTREHRGDPQTVKMGDVWGPTPAWHDLMIEVAGPVVGDIEATFRERWEDPTPPALDPISRAEAWIHRDDEHPDPLPAQLPDPAPCGDLEVQVLRTYPRKWPRFPFAPSGERSIAKGYAKAATRARQLIYIEDQYVWSAEVISCFAQALREQPELHMIVVLSTYTTADTRIANASAMDSRIEALTALYAAGGDRVHVYGLENPWGTPVYVHAKVCVVDDTWMAIGSDNVNRRSWTYDSELTCSVHDASGRLPVDTRLTLAREHLDRADGDDADLVDPMGMVDAFRSSAARLQAWYDGGKVGDRPAGRLRPYVTPQAPRGLDKVLGRLVYAVGDDPDGRPPSLRGTDRF